LQGGFASTRSANPGDVADPALGFLL